LFRCADKSKASIFSEIGDLIMLLLKAISDGAITINELEQISKELSDLIRKIREIRKK